MENRIDRMGETVGSLVQNFMGRLTVQRREFSLK
jgi:hypothetical protein